MTIPPHSRAPLARLIDPRSVAVVGASETPASFGARTLANLSGFTGELYPINPKYTSLGGLKCYPSLASLPTPPDCVVLAVPRAAVEGMLKQAGEAGAGGVIVYASGFAETGHPDDAALQRRLTALAAQYAMPLIGPNCVGLINTATGMNASFSSIPAYSPPGAAAIGVVSQSGAMGISLLQAAERGVNFSHMLTVGNAAGADVADLLEYLVAAPECKSIACQFEGLADPLKLLRVGRLAKAAGKAVIVHKLAQGKEGASVALSHTGSLAGTPAYYDALFRKAGFVTVDNLESLLETAVFFAKAGRSDIFGAGVLSGSGGAAILAADCAEKHGVDLPPFEPQVQAVIEAHMPDFGAARNPCDLTAQVLNKPETMPACARALLQSSNIGVLIVTQNVAIPGTERAAGFAALARETGKTVCFAWMSEWLEGPGAREAESSGVALFRSLDRCMAAIAKLREWTAFIARTDDFVPVAGALASARGNELLAGAQDGVLTERAAKQLIAAYGICVAAERAVASAGDAATAAQELGFPVVLKIESPDILHKTEAGGVRLNLRSREEVSAAFDGVTAAVRRHAPGARIDGALVQAMVPAGLEIIVGGRIDPQFGPVLLLGLGGVFVELLQDTVAVLCPVSVPEAQLSLDLLKGRRLLEGFRGSEPVDRARLAQAISSASELLANHQQLLSEFEINPLVCSGARITAVDGLAVLAPTPAAAGPALTMGN